MIIYARMYPRLKVSEITDYIKRLLEDSFSGVMVEGEISNCRPSSAGHLYFTLKDDGAAISVVFFKNRMSGFANSFNDGMKVCVTGNISVYPQRGTYQIIAEKIEQIGAGDILIAMEALKRRLADEGLFDSSRKKTIPPFPQTVAVITSPTGAALRDILQIMYRRNPSIAVTILPAPVQGDDAAAIIVRQIKTACEYALGDVIIVGRGGGSLEDLAPFSDESVVRAIAGADIPIISAVGHEIDWALSDFAADVRAPTPSAAAELVSPERTALLSTIRDAEETISEAIENQIEQIRLLLRVFSSEAMELQFRKIEQPLLLRFDDAKESLFASVLDRVSNTRARISLLKEALECSNPEAILDKGYCVVSAADTGRVLRGVSDTAEGALLNIRAARARVEARVQSVKLPESSERRSVE